MPSSDCCTACSGHNYKHAAEVAVHAFAVVATTAAAAADIETAVAAAAVARTVVVVAAALGSTLEDPVAETQAEDLETAEDDRPAVVVGIAGFASSPFASASKVAVLAAAATAVVVVAAAVAVVVVAAAAAATSFGIQAGGPIHTGGAEKKQKTRTVCYNRVLLPYEHTTVLRRAFLLSSNMETL